MLIFQAHILSHFMMLIVRSLMLMIMTHHMFLLHLVLKNILLVFNLDCLEK